MLISNTEVVPNKLVLDHLVMVQAIKGDLGKTQLTPMHRHASPLARHSARHR